jgi:hypothetical protein
MGICQKVVAAKSLEELNNLVEISKKWEYISAKTLRRVQRLAKIRRQELD